MNIRSIAFAAVITVSLAGCQEAASITEGPKTPAAQPTLCVVSDFRQDVVAAQCTAGQPVAYLPDRFGNEQLPIMFAAVNCDLSKQVVHTNGGVACTYRPVTIKKNADSTATRPAG